MKKLESSLMNMVLVLTGVAVIMGGILAYVNHLTEGPINDQKAKALADGIKSVMGVSDITVAKTDTVKQNDAKGKELTYIIYQTKDAQGKDLGAAVESTSGTRCEGRQVVPERGEGRHHRQGPQGAADRIEGRWTGGCHHGLYDHQPCLPAGCEQCL